MSEAARVVRLSGYGENRLREAIQSGMLTADAERAYRQVIEDNKRLRRENRVLRERLAIVQASRRNERRDRVEAYRLVLAKDAEYQQARDWRTAGFVAAAALGGILVAIATTLAVMFGG